MLNLVNLGDSAAGLLSVAESAVRFRQKPFACTAVGSGATSAPNQWTRWPSVQLLRWTAGGQTPLDRASRGGTGQPAARALIRKNVTGQHDAAPPSMIAHGLVMRRSQVRILRQCGPMTALAKGATRHVGRPGDAGLGAIDVTSWWSVRLTVPSDAGDDGVRPHRAVVRGVIAARSESSGQVPSSGDFPGAMSGIDLAPSWLVRLCLDLQLVYRGCPSSYSRCRTGLPQFSLDREHVCLVGQVTPAILPVAGRSGARRWPR